MRAAGVLAVLTCVVWLGCGEAPRTPAPAPDVTLTAQEQEVWKPLAPDRSAIPVLLYHGIGPASDFSNGDDASYGVGAADFAKQMTMIHHAGYRTVGLQTFIDFVDGKQVDLPPRPLLLTFDDARADSWTGGDGILAELGFSAVMFVDVGRVDDENPEYLRWDELKTADESGRWELQLHSGKGHVQIHYGSGDDDYGPFYAYEEQDEDFDGWRERVRSDIEWGQDALAEHGDGYRPLAFSPPYGSYGQDGTNDEKIPPDLLAWLSDRYEAVFTQDVDARARPGAKQPLGRIQVTRGVTGGDLHARLLSGKP
jgi:peptidoglycan/xylan/chitin deacetylase (PgdA/CDA1 family)